MSGGLSFWCKKILAPLLAVELASSFFNASAMSVCETIA
jgi:hypothetical protein